MAKPKVYITIERGMVWETAFKADEVEVFVKDEDAAAQGGCRGFCEQAPDRKPYK